MAIDSGSTGFIIVCMALVNLMTPGLAFFYGGLVRQQNVLTIIMQNFVAMGLVTMIWIVWGFSLCFGKSGKMFGSPSTYPMLSNIEDKDDVIPGLVFAGASPPRRKKTPFHDRESPKPSSADVFSDERHDLCPRRAHDARVRRRATPRQPSHEHQNMRVSRAFVSFEVPQTDRCHERPARDCCVS